MTYYTLEVDIKTPIRQQITVPTGNDFAVVVYTLVNGHRSKYYHGQGSQIISEASWSFPSDQISNLIDSSAYKLSPAVFGEDAYMTLYFKGSYTAGSKQTYFICDRLNYFNDEGSLVSFENYNPKIQFTLDIVFVEKAKNCDGPDYNLDIIGNVSTKNLSTTALSATTAQFAAKQASYKMKERDVVGQTVLPTGQVTYLYNNNGMSVLSGNLCLKQDLSVKPNKSSASSGLFLGDYSKAIVAKDITVGNETITVLTVVNT